MRAEKPRADWPAHRGENNRKPYTAHVENPIKLWYDNDAASDTERTAVSNRSFLANRALDAEQTCLHKTIG